MRRRRQCIDDLAGITHGDTHGCANPIHAWWRRHGSGAVGRHGRSGTGNRDRDFVFIRPDELELHGIGRGERVLFKTQNSSRRWWVEDFAEDFVYVSQEVARYLADRGVRSVGVDYLSVGGFWKDSVEIHQALLGTGTGSSKACICRG